MNENESPQKGSTLYLVKICLVATLGGLLFGYDTGVISDAIGFLTKHFGLGVNLEGWAMSCAILGCIVGVLIAGVFGDRLGRKKLLVLSGALFALSALGTAFPPNFTVFIMFRVLGGIGIGAASMASPLYIAEISPARIRGRMVSLNQLAIVTGFLLVYFANYYIARQGTEAWNEHYGWRWMFGCGFVPAVLFLLLLLMVPESPRWLVEMNRREEALDVLTRVNGPDAAAAELAAIEKTIVQEEGTVLQLLRPGLRTALFISIALAVLQQVTGINAFLYYGPEIFKKLGSTTDAALLQQILVGAVNMLFTVVAIWTVDRWGRKPLMIFGSAGMGIALFGMGLAAWFNKVDVWLLGLILGYIACFALSVGPVTWVILSEIFPTKIRGRAMAAATVFLWGADFLVTQTAPLLNKNPWLVETFNKSFPFFLYGIFCVVEVIFVWLAVPETKGRTLEEIERSWKRES